MFPFLLAVWSFIWPIISTVGGIIVFIYSISLAWPFVRRTVAVTDIVATLPEAIAEVKSTIAEVKSTLDTHITDSKAATSEWNGMKGDLHQLILTAEEVRHEVKHNGGTSIKDAVARIETAVTSPESAFVTGNLRLYNTQKGSTE